MNCDIWAIVKNGHFILTHLVDDVMENKPKEFRPRKTKKMCNIVLTLKLLSLPFSLLMSFFVFLNVIMQRNVRHLLSFPWKYIQGKKKRARIKHEEKYPRHGKKIICVVNHLRNIDKKNL